MPIVEKAYAQYRTGANTYTSLDGGPPSSALAGLNAAWVGYQRFGRYASGQAILDDIGTKLSAGKALTVGFSVVTGDCPCVQDHAYTVVGVNRNAAGQVTSVVLRNPWGYDGAGNDANTQDGLVTVTAKQLFSCDGGVRWGDVA